MLKTIIPAAAMELGRLLKCAGNDYSKTSLAHPMRCSIGAFHAAYQGCMGLYVHEIGNKENRNQWARWTWML